MIEVTHVDTVKCNIVIAKSNETCPINTVSGETCLDKLFKLFLFFLHLISFSSFNFRYLIYT